MRRDNALDVELAPFSSFNACDHEIADDGILRLLVVSHLRLLREGISRTLQMRGFDRVTLGSASTLLADLPHIEPHVAILDVTAPSMLNAVRSLGEQRPEVKLIALGVDQGDAAVLACAEAGVAGYLASESGSDDLIAAIESVRRGELFCSPHVAGILFRRIATRAPGSPQQESIVLTRREQEVLSLVERGLSNKEIAGQLSIRLTTVKNHVHHILEKLHVRRRGAAAARLRGAVATPGHPSITSYTR